MDVIRTSVEPASAGVGDPKFVYRRSAGPPTDDIPEREEEELPEREDTGPAEPPIGWAEALGQDVENPPEARTHGNKLYEPDGTEHTVATCENRIKAQFELWVRNNALKAIADVENTGDVDNADKMRSAYVGDSGAGHYLWDGKYVRRARFQDVPGIRYLLYLLMVRCDPKKTEREVSDLMTKYPKQCGELVRLALGNSQPPAEKAGVKNDPKRTARIRENPNLD